VALIVKPPFHWAVGVPEIVPVVELRDKPDGKLPLETTQV
jgi:hypothetical protein